MEGIIGVGEENEVAIEEVRGTVAEAMTMEAGVADAAKEEGLVE